MRRALTLSFVFLLLFVTGCASIFSVKSLQLTGSGKIASQSFTFDKADRLLVASNFKVTFTAGDKVAVTAHADDNVMEHVYVHVSNGELRLELKPGSYNMNNVTMKAEVTMPVPNAITLENNATLDLGSGIKASEMTVSLNGNAILTGRDASIPRLNFIADGNGMAQLSGAVAELTIDGKGNAKFVSPNVQVHTAKITLRNNAGAILKVTDKLDYNVSGNAGIVYTGSPKLGEQKRSENATVTQK